jgi:hypothetical protein
VLHLKKIIRGSLDVLSDLVAVVWPEEQGPQDEHVECTLE